MLLISLISSLMDCLLHGSVSWRPHANHPTPHNLFFPVGGMNMPRQRCTFKYQLLGFPLSKTFFSDFSLCLRRGISYIPVNTFLFEDMRVLPLCQCPFCSGWNKDFWNAQPALVWKPRDCVLVWRRKYRDFFLNAHILVDWVLNCHKI